MMKHLKFIVSGKVQGVNYRTAAKEAADKLGLKGSICNLSNGTVQIDVEGEQEVINRFYAWCQEGPPRAVVAKIEVSAGEWQGYPAFSITQPS